MGGQRERDEDEDEDGMGLRKEGYRCDERCVGRKVCVGGLVRALRSVGMRRGAWI